jgi:hippurate hydrolase
VYDPIVACAQLIMALQTIVSRRVDPLDAAVLSVTRLQAGESQNVIPDVVELAGTVRTLRDEVDMEVERRVRQLCAGVAASSDVAVELDYTVTCPATVNDVSETETAARAARRVGGEAKVRTDLPPMMIGEDFAFMLRERPGAFIFIGNGDSAGLHQSNYDFDDRAIAHGISYWINLLSSNGGRRPA